MLAKVITGLGIRTVLHFALDTHLLLPTRFLHGFAYGSSTLLLTVYFCALRHPDSCILTLARNILTSLSPFTFAVDAFSRRRILLPGSFPTAAPDIVFALSSKYRTFASSAQVGTRSDRSRQ